MFTVEMQFMRTIPNIVTSTVMVGFDTDRLISMGNTERSEHLIVRRTFIDNYKENMRRNGFKMIDIEITESVR